MLTQKERLKTYLLSGNKVTRLESFNLLGICELSSRVGELIKDGFPIHKEPVVVTNRWGEKCRVIEYSHIKEGQMVLI